MTQIDYDKIRNMIDKDPIIKKASPLAVTEGITSSGSLSIKNNTFTTPQVNNNTNDEDDDFYGTLPNKLDEFYSKVNNRDLQVKEYQQFIQPQQRQQVQQQIKKSKLPKSILESMLNNPIEISDPMYSTSVTSKLFGNIEPQQREVQQFIEPQQRQQVVNEAISIPSTSQIDYSLIKTIIESVITEKLKETLEDIVLLKIGKDLTIMDNKGNYYKSNLKKIGNVNS